VTSRRASAPRRLIGLTGNIGTGKSTVAAMLAELGAEVIDADRVAHEVMRAGTPAHGRVVEAFGPEVLDPDGEIDRARFHPESYPFRELSTRFERYVGALNYLRSLFFSTGGDPFESLSRQLTRLV